MNIINKIYDTHEIVYICIGSGNYTLLPDFLVKDVFNIKKTAVIYIAECSTDFPPFWLKRECRSELFVEVSEENMFDAFDNLKDTLTNGLDVYILEYRIPHKLDYFFDRLNNIITKKTLFHLGFTGCGSITNTHIETFLNKISKNKNMAFNVCGQLPNIPFFEGYSNGLIVHRNMTNIPHVLKDKFIDFLMLQVNHVS